MLPTNPQSMSTAEKSILENLREQGAQIDRQTSVMEKLVDRIARVVNSEEKIEKKNKKNDREIKGDTKIKDVPGLLIDKLADKLDDSITKQFLKIKDSFKKEKQEPATKTQEPAPKEKEKSKDETDTLKAILNSMIGNSKYQEQMAENSKALQSIVDKTLTNVDDLSSNLKNIEQPEANNTEKENNTEERNNKKEGKIDKNQKLAIAIGVSIGAALKPQFDNLGKTLKEAFERGFTQLATAIDNLDSSMGGFDLSGIVDLPGGKDEKDGKGGKDNKGGKGDVIDKAKEFLKGPGLRRFVPLAIGSGLYNAAESQKPEIDKEIKEYQNEKKRKEEEERLADLKKQSASGQLIKPETRTETKLSVEEIENRNKKIKDGTNTDIGVDGKEVIPAPAPAAAASAPPAAKAEVKNKTDKPAVVNDMSRVLGIDSSDKKHPLADRLNQSAETLNVNRSMEQKQTSAGDQMKNMGSAGGRGPAAGEKEQYERLKAAENIDPKVLEWARKRYKDDNIGDPGYLSQDIGQNKSILEWLQKNQDFIKRNPNYNLEAPAEKKKVPEVKQKKNDKTGMLSEVTDTKMALVENKNTQPTVITNNNNYGGGSETASIGFGSASPRNTSTAINDYLRNNARLHDAVA